MMAWAQSCLGLMMQSRPLPSEQFRILRAVELGNHLAHTQLVGKKRNHQVLLIHVGERNHAVHTLNILLSEGILIRAISVDNCSPWEILRQGFRPPGVHAPEA